MHEASIALSILEQIEKYESENNVCIEKVFFEIGKGSGVNLSSLSFCLEEMKKQWHKNVAFEFTEKPIIAACDNCGSNVELEYPTYICPNCNNFGIEIIAGLEFKITEFEVC